MVPISMVAAIPYAQAYPVIAWLAWVPNLIVAEIYIAARRTGSVRSAASA